MKFYSEATKKLYDSEEDLKKAESKLVELQKKEEEKKQARATRAKEVEEAFKSASDAYSNAYKLLKEFTQDYGSFHMTLNDGFKLPSFFDIFF